MNYWICDSCEKKINKPEDGWVEWVRLAKGESPSGRGIRLVHSFAATPKRGGESCQYNGEKVFKQDRGTIADLPLSELLGADGLMKLLLFIENDELPADEVIEMIKRLNISGYEQTRGYFESAIREGVIKRTLKGFYSQDEIQKTLEFIKLI